MKRICIESKDSPTGQYLQKVPNIQKPEINYFRATQEDIEQYENDTKLYLEEKSACECDIINSRGFEIGKVYDRWKMQCDFPSSSPICPICFDDYCTMQVANNIIPEGV